MKVSISRFVTITLLILNVSGLGTLSGDNAKDTPQQAITYPENKNRFGDIMLIYLHAKWLSYKYGLPLLYKPFAYSDKLVLHTQEPFLATEWQDQFVNKVTYANNLDLASLPKSTLINVRFFPENVDFIREKNRLGFDTRWYLDVYFPVDWEDKKFRSLLRKLVAPRIPLKLITPPKQHLSVAMHVRDGGTFDGQPTKDRYPDKFPKIDFYVAGLEAILERYPMENIYVHIFTDALQPEKYQALFEEKFSSHKNIYFGCRKNQGKEDYVLADFFSMLEYDCLIRPESCFTVVVERLKTFKVVVSPIHLFKKKGTSYIDYVDGICVKPHLQNK